MSEHPCHYAGLIVSPSRARFLSEHCIHGDECRCKEWRTYESPPPLSEEGQRALFDPADQGLTKESPNPYWNNVRSAK